MRRLAFLLPIFFFCAVLSAQRSAAPILRQRGAPALDETTVAHGRSTLPEDVSGEYEFGRPGEVIEITLDNGVLSGYISLLGDEESGPNTPLTYFFDRVSAQRRQIGFVTKQIHGVWYVFKGTIGRGPGTVREDEGYYLLEGAMTIHDAARGTETRRILRLKSVPEFNARMH